MNYTYTYTLNPRLVHEELRPRMKKFVIDSASDYSPESIRVVWEESDSTDIVTQVVPHGKNMPFTNSPELNEAILTEFRDFVQRVPVK